MIWLEPNREAESGRRLSVRWSVRSWRARVEVRSGSSLGLTVPRLAAWFCAARGRGLRVARKSSPGLYRGLETPFCGGGADAGRLTLAPSLNSPRIQF
jgi:hypothetical protein